ncbi:hypothetical protein OROGR_028919 [Orobanche gracilis]
MAYRGRGRGRGRGNFNFGSRAAQVPLELFPVIEDLGTAVFSEARIQLTRWSLDLQKFWKNSPYYCEDGEQRRPENAKTPDIERYSDRKSQTKKVKSQLRDFIMLDSGHIAAELAEYGGKKRKRVAKKIRWNPELGQDIFDKFEKMDQGGDDTEKNESGDEEDEVEIDEDDGEFSDEGDYERNRDYDDDEDDYNMIDDGDDEPFF